LQESVSSVSDIMFRPKSVGQTPTYFFIFFIRDMFNWLPRGVEPGPAGCYSGALLEK